MICRCLKSSSVWLVAVMLLTACSSQIPPEIRLKPDNAPNVGQVRDQLDAHISENVRWGGVILNTENKQQTSWLTIVSLPLNDNGVPLASDNSEGRFLAIVDEFLEPLVYSRDRQITVTGQIVRSEPHKVGEFIYEYPVIKVDHYYLWPKKVDPAYIGYPSYWHYDPWYYPYYPYPHRRHINRH